MALGAAVRSARRAAPLVALGLAAACQGEPGRLCDRIRIVWPYLEIGAADDLLPAVDGIQIDLALRTNLEPGIEVVLSVTPEDGDPVTHPTPGATDADGALAFEAVTVPVGRIELAIVARDACGPIGSSRQVYVWDGAGFPACALTLGVEPAPSEAHAPLGVVTGEDDVDPDAPGIQVPVRVDAGRPDMEVAIFVREVATAADQVHEEASGEDLAVEIDATVPPGEVAIRAVCTWPPEGLHPSSHTERFFVEP